MLVAAETVSNTFMQELTDIATTIWLWLGSILENLAHLYSHPMTEWNSFEWFIINMTLFVPLAFIIPSKREQPLFHRGTATDGLYCFCGPLLYGPASRFIALFFVSLSAIQFIQLKWNLSHLSLFVQIPLILLLTDFLQYWAHRLFHHKLFWKFHAIHHSSTHVDWLTSARFHPINFILYSTAINALVATLGFSYDALKILLPFNVIFSPLVHANLNWTYGPFKYVLASPIFHRWHHTHPHEGGHKNFAPSFPFLDIMFGTFYMPEGKKPEIFGTPHDPITGGLIQHLVYPFLPTPASQENSGHNHLSVTDRSLDA
jgi:sterol desaturase/sphingolipid hydroxylase (fatty acid hydroxylase superfamily)